MGSAGEPKALSSRESENSDPSAYRTSGGPGFLNADGPSCAFVFCSGCPRRTQLYNSSEPNVVIIKLSPCCQLLAGALSQRQLYTGVKRDLEISLQAACWSHGS